MRIKIRYCSFFWLFIILMAWNNTSIYAQGWLNTFDNFFYVHQILPDTSVGYYLGGFEQVDANSSAAVLSKINDDGELLWKRNFHPGARITGLVKNGDGSIVALTRKASGNFATDSLHLAFFSPNGTFQQEIFLRETGDTEPFPSGDIQSIGAQRYIIAGTDQILSNPAGTLWATDLAGTLRWERDSIDMPRVLDMQVSGDAILLAGRVKYPDEIEQDGLLFFDSLGNNTQALLYPPFAGKAKIIPVQDGWILYTANASFDAWIRGISQNGTTTLSVQDMSLISESAHAVPGNAVSLFYTAGISRSADYLGQLVLQSYGPTGQVQQKHRIILPGYEQKSLYLTAMSPANDGGFIIAGGITLSSSLTKYFTARIDTTGQVFEHFIIGQVFSDTNQNCSPDAAEIPLGGHKVRVQNVTKNTTSVYLTDNEGRFVVVSDYDSLTFSVIPPNPYWQNNCFDEIGLQIHPDLPTDTTQIAFPLTAVVDCGFLETDIGTAYLSCGGNAYHIQYCNTGTIPVSDAYIVVSLDPAMQILDAEIPFTASGSNTLRFDLEPLPVGHCNAFAANIYLDCGTAGLEETHCVSAHIYPDTFCLSEAGWSGASIEVSGTCEGDSVLFLIRNTGTAPNAEVLEYRIIEDIIVYFNTVGSGGFQLAPGEEISVRVPANGSTWRLEADQEPNHPGNSMPTAVVEGCGINGFGTFSTGFVSQFGEDDADPFVSIDCRSSQDFSKTGFPLGTGAAHLIAPGQDIEYIILFRNTGTDTVQQVIIRDTLSALLDPASVVPGAASHPYTFELYGEGYLKWTMTATALPDSNINAVASAGFVKFRVKQRDNLPPGALITNIAAIYFDDNAPINTNITYHQVDTGYLQYCFVNTNAGRQLEIWPNPVSPQAVIFLPEVPCGTIKLTDTNGRLIREFEYSGGKFQLPAPERIADGLYLIQVFNGRDWIGSGKIVFVN